MGAAILRLALALCAATAQAFSTVPSVRLSVPSSLAPSCTAHAPLLHAFPRHARTTARAPAKASTRGGLRALQMGGGEVLENMLRYPQTWTFALLGCVLALGWGFEKTLETIEEYIDARMMPVVKQSVLELATLGFIGLVVEATTVGHSNIIFASLSEHFLGKTDSLFEEFERLHSGLFATTITFFVTCAILIGSVNAQFQEWDYDRRHDYVKFKLAEYDWKLNSSVPFTRRGWNHLAQSMVIADERSIEADPLRQLVDELAKPRQARIAEFLRFRERFMVQARNDGVRLPNGFRFSDYLEEHASKTLVQLVSIDVAQQARIWLPLAVVALAAEALADVANGVGNEASGLFVVFCLSQLVLGVWSLANFFKMRSVKAQLRPQLSKRKNTSLCADCSCEGFTCARRGYQVMRLLPPSFALAGGSRTVKRSLPGLEVLEGVFGREAHCRHDGLFGSVGANFYLTSMKSNLFNAIVSLAVGTNMLLETHSISMVPALVPAVGSIILMPSTFMMYNWATSIESKKDLPALRQVLSEQRAEAFRSKIRTLFKLCLIFDTVSGQGSAQCTLASKQPTWDQIQVQGNPDAILNLLVVFGIADLDLDGYISPSEAAALASTLGYRLTLTEIQMMVELLDGDGDGLITFPDFASTILYTGWSTAASADQTLKRVFSFFDRNGDGMIQVSEMLDRLEVLGFDTDGVEQLFADISGSRQGDISRADFVAYVSDDYDYILTSTERIAKMDLSGDAKRLRAARYADQVQELQREVGEGYWGMGVSDVDDLLGINGARGLTVRGRVGEQKIPRV